MGFSFAGNSPALSSTVRQVGFSFLLETLLLLLAQFGKWGFLLLETLLLSLAQLGKWVLFAGNSSALTSTDRQVGSFC